MRLLLVDDTDLDRRAFQLMMKAPSMPWMRNVELIDRDKPLDNLEDYYEFDGAIFDQCLGLFNVHGNEVSGLQVCQSIHAYQYASDDAGNRTHRHRPTALMLLTGIDYRNIPFNARDYVDQIAYKHGSGDRHVDDVFGCVRALMRSINRAYVRPGSSE